MTELALSDSEQTGLCRVLAFEPDAGPFVRDQELLERLAHLIPCDALGIWTIDEDGIVVQELAFPTGFSVAADHGHRLSDQVPLGLTHWSRAPGLAIKLRRIGVCDRVCVSAGNGSGVSQVWLHRTCHLFRDRDLALMRLLTPVLERMLRERPTHRLPRCLTGQERRVLLLAAAGYDSAEVAERLFIAPSTVRKHLEHAYRKLGVRNRIAAVNAIQERPSRAS